MVLWAASFWAGVQHHAGAAHEELLMGGITAPAMLLAGTARCGEATRLSQCACLPAKGLGGLGQQETVGRAYHGQHTWG